MFGFSLKYDGTFFAAEDLTLLASTSPAPNVLEKTYALGPIRIVRTLKDFGTAQHVTTEFENVSNENSGTMSEICDLDTEFDLPLLPLAKGLCGYGKPHYTRLKKTVGSNLDDKEFTRTEEVIRPGDDLRFGPIGGRASRGYAPFFEVSEGDRGVLVAVGWTGQWFAEVTAASAVRIRAGVDGLGFFLKPHERVRTASVLTMPFTEGSERAHNALKRLLKEEFCPKLTEPLPFFASFWGGCTTDFLLRQLNMLQENKVHFDGFWLDAGWYGHAVPEVPGQFDDEWGGQTGSWAPNPILHPDGLEQVARKVQDMGMRFMLWMEPERVCLPSDLAIAHPELLLYEPDTHWCALLDLGLPAARDLMFDLVAGYVKKLGLSLYRQDFNIDPLPFWTANDAPGRAGITQLKYIAGLYEVWDRLREAFPHLIIDNCASGGRRIDLESMSRSIPFWRSDYQCSFDSEAEAAQNHGAGISQWLPYSATGIGQYVYDRYMVRSTYAAAANTSCFGYEHLADKTVDAAALRAVIEEFHAVRDYFSCDFYALFEARDHASWAGWQYDRPEQHDGILLLFRRDKSPFDRVRVRLKGLDADKRYVIRSADGLPKAEFGGKTLMDEGMPLTIDAARTSRLFFYRVK